jgi:hypothetical protein
MPLLAIDSNVEGHVAVLLDICSRSEWTTIWKFLDVSVVTFSELGLEHSSKDTDVWTAVQRADAVLITGNRNHDGPESLEAVIRSSNTEQSLPVVTLADPDRILSDEAYRNRTVERLLDVLLELEQYRGTGRLFIP